MLPISNIRDKLTDLPDNELNAFILDCFPDIYRTIFTDGLDKVSKINKILERVSREDVSSRLESWNRSAVRKFNLERPNRPNFILYAVTCVSLTALTFAGWFYFIRTPTKPKALSAEKLVHMTPAAAAVSQPAPPKPIQDEPLEDKAAFSTPSSRLGARTLSRAESTKSKSAKNENPPADLVRQPNVQINNIGKGSGVTIHGNNATVIQNF